MSSLSLSLIVFCSMLARMIGNIVFVKKHQVVKSFSVISQKTKTSTLNWTKLASKIRFCVKSSFISYRFRSELAQMISIVVLVKQTLISEKKRLWYNFQKTKNDTKVEKLSIKIKRFCVKSWLIILPSLLYDG